MEEAHWGFDWESMTEKCIEAIVLAQREAEFLLSPFVGTEHVLIGLLSSHNLGAEVLGEFQVDAPMVRATLEKFRSRQSSHAVRPFSWRVRLALETAFDEARARGQAFINTDHLYLGVLKQEDCGAFRILVDLQTPIDRVLARLGHGRPRPLEGAEAMLYPQEFLESLRVAGGEEVPEAEKVAEPAPSRPQPEIHPPPATGLSLDLDSFLGVLDELGRALQSAQRVVEAMLPHEASPPALQFPEIDEDWPVVDEQVYPIGRLVRQILAGAVLRRATCITFEPQERRLRLEYHLASGEVEAVEVPGVLGSVIPFKVMRLAHLDPMEKGRELEGKLVFRFRRRAYPMSVRSEPVRRGLRVVVLLTPG